MDFDPAGVLEKVQIRRGFGGVVCLHFYSQDYATPFDVKAAWEETSFKLSIYQKTPLRRGGFLSSLIFDADGLIDPSEPLKNAVIFSILGEQAALLNPSNEYFAYITAINTKIGEQQAILAGLVEVFEGAEASNDSPSLIENSVLIAGQTLSISISGNAILTADASRAIHWVEAGGDSAECTRLTSLVLTSTDASIIPTVSPDGFAAEAISVDLTVDPAAIILEDFAGDLPQSRITDLIDDLDKKLEGAITKIVVEGNEIDGSALPTALAISSLSPILLISVNGDTLELGIDPSEIKTSDLDNDESFISATNLSYVVSPAGGIIGCDTGTDATIPLADGTNSGLLSPADFTKLSGISGFNTGDQNLFSAIASTGQSDIIATTASSTLNIEAGTNIEIETNATTKTLTISAAGGTPGATNLSYVASPTDGIIGCDTGTDATIPLADATNAGLLAPADFTKLSGISGFNTGDQNLFSTIASAGQSSIVATTASSTLNIEAGTNLNIATSSNSLTINANIPAATFLPASPVDGQLVWLKVAGREVLYLYNQSSFAWRRLKATGTYTVYVDSSVGSNSEERGTQLSPYSSLSYAIGRLPDSFDPGVTPTINLAAGTYTGNIIIPDNIRLRIVGAMSEISSGTCTSYGGRTSTVSGGDVGSGYLVRCMSGSSPANVATAPLLGISGGTMTLEASLEYGYITDFEDGRGPVSGFSYSVFSCSTVTGYLRVGKNSTLQVEQVNWTASASSSDPNANAFMNFSDGSLTTWWRCTIGTNAASANTARLRAVGASVRFYGCRVTSTHNTSDSGTINLDKNSTLMFYGSALNATGNISTAFGALTLRGGVARLRGAGFTINNRIAIKLMHGAYCAFGNTSGSKVTVNEGSEPLVDVVGSSVAEDLYNTSNDFPSLNYAVDASSFAN